MDAAHLALTAFRCGHGTAARRAGRSATPLHRITGGNPFFVTNVLPGRTAVTERYLQSVREGSLDQVTGMSATDGLEPRPEPKPDRDARRRPSAALKSPST
jgi:hypothetical protein